MSKYISLCGLYVILLLCTVVCSPSTAFAACASPVGAGGDIIYNSSRGLPEYCDDTNWIAMVQCDGAGGDCVSGFSSDTNLIAYWKFDEASGATTAADSTGNGNTGTLTNMNTATAWVAGQVGNGLTFDGTNDYVNAGSAAMLDNLAAFTICAWTKSTYAAGAFFQVASKYDASFSNGWDLYYGGRGTSERGVGFLDVDPGYSIHDEWHHFCATNDGSNLKIYQDSTDAGGSQQAYGGGGSDAANSLYIGNDIGGADDFSGIIDEMRIYNRVLAQAEIAEIYSYTGTGGCGGPTGAVGDITYNSTYKVMQACTPAGWRAMGPIGSSGIGVVQTSVASVCTGGCNTSGVNRTFTTTPVIGNTIIAALSGGGDATAACNVSANAVVTDTSGNTYTKAAASNQAGAFAGNSGIWIAPVTASAGPFTVSVAPNHVRCDGFYTLNIMEARGLLTAGAVDATGTNWQNNVTSITVTASAGTTQAYELVVATLGSSAGTDGFTAGVGWTRWTGGTADAFPVYKILTATGTPSHTWSNSVTAYDLSSALVTLKGVLTTPPTCSSPTGDEGDMTYNTTSSKMQYCNGVDWMAIGP